uniref:Mitochondrial splicing suppressor 51-like C-terminal domain-containing protein n=1 Tax=Pseudo-nitzschia australis TaxID=44445 RepID=A0A7S4AIQ1_9STRA
MPASATVARKVLSPCIIMDDFDDDDNDDDDDFQNNETMRPTNISARAKSPLCLHCRRPTNHLCKGCSGAYFCPPPDTCSTLGWSHSCQCRTWKSYVSRRKELSTFEYLDPEWQAPLVGREFQLSEEPYKKFLTSRLMIKRSVDLARDGNTDNVYHNEDEDGCKDQDSSSSFSSWWLTETDGWAGGDSVSARQVDITLRSSFEQGFAPIPSDQLPPSQRVCDRDYERAGLLKKENNKNAVGLWRLSSWEDYYRLRNIPPQSPVALLCTFPLTIYHAIVEYGEVPVTVARMLRRPLRIHVVGTEKELNFLDLFQELGFLLPEDLKIELIFVAREDMLPTKCRTTKSRSSSDHDDRFLLRVEMTSNLTVGVVGGTYGGENNNDPSSTASSIQSATTTTTAILDPNFDCGSGPPDMVIAMNAGLYAYESWRSVIDYLYHNKGVVGVFTDYNEYSGVHCAGLGGAASRESLCINPFRQPLAMPVYSMNLPQFSNGFFYVFNAQELD